MQNPVGNMVIADHVENLGFVNVPGISPGMEDPISINRKSLPMAGLHICLPPDSVPAQRCKAGEKFLLLCIKLLFKIQQPGANMFVLTHNNP
jgi:hypothetical protein